MQSLMKGTFYGASLVCRIHTNSVPAVNIFPWDSHTSPVNWADFSSKSSVLIKFVPKQWIILLVVKYHLVSSGDRKTNKQGLACNRITANP